jgi:hypothetical protein
MSLILSLNESVKGLAQRFDTFQRNVDERLTKVQNEQILMKSKIEFVEKNALGGARLSNRDVNDTLAASKENNRNLFNQASSYLDSQKPL